MVVCIGRKANAGRSCGGKLFFNYDTPPARQFTRVRLWVTPGFVILRRPLRYCLEDGLLPSLLCAEVVKLADTPS